MSLRNLLVELSGTILAHIWSPFYLLYICLKNNGSIEFLMKTWKYSLIVLVSYLVQNI